MGKCMPVFLWASLSASAAGPVVSTAISGQGITVESSVFLPIEPCQAYSMLSDYAALPEFIPGLKESRPVRLSPTEASVVQIGEVQVFIFTVRMESKLDMRETPGKRITFRQVSGDFASYGGEWDFLGVQGGTRVSYRARMTFKPYVPLTLARSVLDEDVLKKFEAIEKEAARKGGSLSCSG